MSHKDPMVAALSKVIVDAARHLEHERAEQARELLAAVASFVTRGESAAPPAVPSQATDTGASEAA